VIFLSFTFLLNTSENVTIFMRVKNNKIIIIIIIWL